MSDSIPLTYKSLLQMNRRWVEHKTARQPDYFTSMAAVHAPHFLWIGCSDARVPANVVTGTKPGEMFVHRNIANQVMTTDPNVLAVLQYAVEALGVKDIIVCGHHGCGGVKAALTGNAPPPHVDGWLGNLRMITRLYERELAEIKDPVQCEQRLVELNVIEQVYNLSRTPVVQKAWDAGHELRLHAWVYETENGCLRELGSRHEPPLAVEVQAHSGQRSPEPLAARSQEPSQERKQERAPERALELVSAGS